MLTPKQHALLAVARKALDMNEMSWRATLAQIGHVTSARDLDREGFDAIIGFFEWLGFAPGTVKGPLYGDRPGFASTAQAQLIRALWWEWSLAGGDDRASGLAAWMKRTFDVEDMRFLTGADAGKVITALKAMKARKRAA
ncbi:regulatory protein GemA [Jannaschia rubra]|uniref:regulatory protein GemA n=1 Tax=Jannaschia rubra TaxID=282197 RepID=UPI00248FFF9C|nr:regulatory protein GemA [Jannaschia rubra]